MRLIVITCFQEDFIMVLTFLQNVTDERNIEIE